MSITVQSVSDLRPAYRVAVFGLAQKFQRVLEIVLRHARHNQYRFVIAGSRGPGDFDIALVDMTAKGGAEVATTLRRLQNARPVVTVGRRTDAARGRDDLLQSGFTLHVLETLNAVVDGRRRTPTGPAPTGSMSAAHSIAAAASGATSNGGAGPGSAAPGRWSAPTAIPGSIPAAIPRDAAQVSAGRALVVDDSPTVRRQLRIALAEIGVDSEDACSAEQALDVLAVQRFDLAFIDVVMPEMDGYRLIREIKRDRRLRSMPVVILTSRSSPLDLARGALAGCSSYLVKPVSLQVLRTTVERHLSRLRSRRPS